MNLNVNVDPKLCVGLGVAVCLVIFTAKMDPAAAERVANRAFDSLDRLAPAIIGKC